MDRQQDWFAFLLILAGFAGLSVVSRPAPRTPAAGTATVAPSPAAVPGVVEHPEGAGGLRNALPVLRLIGEHFGLTFGLGPLPPDKKAAPGFGESTLARDGQIETALRRRPIVCGPDGNPMRLAEEAAGVARDIALLARLEPKQGWNELLPRVQANAEVARLSYGETGGCRRRRGAQGLRTAITLTTKRP